MRWTGHRPTTWPAARTLRSRAGAHARPARLGAAQLPAAGHPWHLVGIGLLLAIVGRFLGRMPVASPLIYVGLLLLAVGLLSLVLLPREQPKRWRGRLITLDDSWRARLYRRIYRR